MFNWSKQIGATREELTANRIVYDERYHQAEFQKAGHRALQAFKTAQPRLYGQPRELFLAVEAAVKRLQNADFHRETEKAAHAPAMLESAIKALIDAKPVPFDLEPLKTGNSFTRTPLMLRERDKSLCLLTIPYFEVSRSQGDEWGRACSDWGRLSSDLSVDPLKLIGCINRLHIAAVEMFLEHFALDIPEPVDEIEAAKAVADNARLQVVARQQAHV